MQEEQKQETTTFNKTNFSLSTVRPLFPLFSLLSFVFFLHLLSGGLCLSGGGAQSNELDKCQNCPDNTFKAGAGIYDDECDACVQCDVGATRTGCELASPGVCTGWSTPTVTSVTGTGRDGSGTPGNEILDVTGKFYGPERTGNDAKDVVVKYGKPGTDQVRRRRQKFMFFSFS